MGRLYEQDLPTVSSAPYPCRIRECNHPAPINCANGLIDKGRHVLDVDRCDPEARRWKDSEA